MEETYADVILPLATPAMTYAVPEALRGEIAEGTAVVVQFGKRKFYTGVVCRLHDRRPAAGEVKPIVRPVGEGPLALPVQLKLWQWLSSSELCPAGMVLRAALPARC